MHSVTDNNIGDTVRIRRPARITTDEIGRNTWMGDVDPHPLELVVEENNDPYNSTAPDWEH
ncbi:MAG: hypothetical protein ACR2Q3_20030 [Woeseiaceae bacterium]